MGVTHKQAVESPVEIAFRTRDRDCFFVDASARADCRVELEHFVYRSDGRLLEHFTVEGADPETVSSLAAECPAIDDARLVKHGVNGMLFEFVVSGNCVTTTLADVGAVANSVVAEDGVGRVVATVPGHVDVREVVESFRERHRPSDLLYRHDAAGSIPTRTENGAQASLAHDLTDKQLEVLRTAYLKGYFSWPRETTAGECAEALGISQPTFSQHMRTAEEKLVGQLFEDPATG